MEAIKKPVLGLEPKFLREKVSSFRIMLHSRVTSTYSPYDTEGRNHTAALPLSYTDIYLVCQEGIEPPTVGLKVHRSTSELLAHNCFGLAIVADYLSVVNLSSPHC